MFDRKMTFVLFLFKYSSILLSLLWITINSPNKLSALTYKQVRNRTITLLMTFLRTSISHLFIYRALKFSMVFLNFDIIIQVVDEKLQEHHLGYVLWQVVPFVRLKGLPIFWVVHLYFLIISRLRVEMSLSIFAVRNQWHKNGIWWFTKMLNRVVGEESYNSIRVTRRIFSNKFYYLRQHLLYRCFVESPEVACMLGVYPKVDSSHGYGSHIQYEMYRDFQENTINSDGSFGMWVSIISLIYCLHTAYSYFIPFYWNKTATVKNGEEQRVRLRDALSSMIIEDSYGFQFMEWGFNPHSAHAAMHHMIQGLNHPDDVRASVMATLNRKNRYREHYAAPHFQNKKMIGWNVE